MTLNEAIATLKQGATELTHMESDYGDALLSGSGDAGAIAIASELETNNTLKTLILIRNGVGNAGAIALAKALEINTTLERLYLSYNHIHDAGFFALARALKTNTTLRTLDYI